MVALVDYEVHELESQLGLDLGLGFNSLFDDVTDLFNRIILSLVRHLDPIVQFLVDLNRLFSLQLESIESPVADLGQSESEYGLLVLDGFLHLTEVNRLLEFIFLSGASFSLGVLFACFLGLLSSCGQSSHIWNDLSLDRPLVKLVKSGISIAV